AGGAPRAGGGVPAGRAGGGGAPARADRAVAGGVRAAGCRRRGRPDRLVALARQRLAPGTGEIGPVGPGTARARRRGALVRPLVVLARPVPPARHHSSAPPLTPAGAGPPLPRRPAATHAPAVFFGRALLTASSPPPDGARRDAYGK
ncbi:hypothetical protein MXD60_27410, partial [Frankia sp. AgB32]|nr:hypothetical protein [Frankia sp. AgB32]